MHELDPKLHQSEWADVVVDSLALSHKTADPTRWGFVCLAISQKLNRLIEPCIERLNEVTARDLHVFSFVPLPPTLIDQRRREARSARRSTVQGAAEHRWHRHLAPRETCDFVSVNRSELFRWLECDYPDRDLLFIDVQPRRNEEFELMSYAAKATSLREQASTDETIAWFVRLAGVAKMHRNNPDRTVARDNFIRDFPLKSDLLSATWIALKNTPVGDFLKVVLEKIIGLISH